MRLRNRTVIIFLLPIIIPLWMFGWVLYRKGARGLRRWKEATASDDGVEVTVAVLEEDVEADGQAGT
jgi:hypothetical protein